MGNLVDHLETGEDTIKLVKNADVDEVYRMLSGEST